MAHPTTSSVLRWHVGVDTGGTFTDLVATDGESLRVAKVASTPPEFDQGVLDVIDAADLAIDEIAVLAHGTTVATNALITREGNEIALLTTRGFRDVLELRRHNRGELYDLLWDPPEPLVRRRNRFEVRERIDYAGRVIVALEESDVAHAVEVARKRGISTFAVAYIHSYANASHEERTRQVIEQLAPGCAVYCSAEILREPGEFERTSTVVVNAFLGPVVSSYLESLRQRLDGEGFAGRLFVMHSGGGLLTAETAVKTPARLVTSGPAAGAMAAERVFSGASAGARSAAAGSGANGNVISLDMGGTSADIAVIREGRARLVNEYAVEFGLPIRFPAIDLTTIGAGGGSIAWVDDGGLPSVGPRSAGALPGPAAYGHGGQEPCVTDANVILGRLGPDTPLAGGVALDAEAARAAVAAFAEALGMSIEDAALGIVEVTNRNMARAIRLVTVERGLDPREFALVSFGGAGGLHAAELAAMLGIGRVIVPVSPGVTSALGCLFVDIVHDASSAFITPLLDADRSSVLDAFRALEETVIGMLELDAVEPERRGIELSIDLRFEGQRRGLTLLVGRHDLEAGMAELLLERFLEEYEKQFHYSTREISVEIAALRARGRGIQAQPASASFRAPGTTALTCELAAREKRTVILRSGPVDAAVVERELLGPGTVVAGAALVHEYDSTTWVPPDWFCETDSLGRLVLTRSSEDSDLQRLESKRFVSDLVR